MLLHVHQGNHHRTTKVRDKPFKEEEHPRGQPENAGEFAKGGSKANAKPPEAVKGKAKAAEPQPGEGAAHKQSAERQRGAARAERSESKQTQNIPQELKKAATKSGETAPSSGVSIEATKDRAWTGTPNEGATRLSKQEAGALGERIAISYLQNLGLKDARGLNSERSNFPVDLVGDHEVFEVKTGQVSNSAAASQWRATIGQPSKTEAEWLKTASMEDKRKHNQAKSAAIMARKQKVVDEYSKEVGRPIVPKTMTLIIDPDKGIADVFVFDGFHSRIGYNGADAQAGYVGSYRYTEGQPRAGRGKAGDRAIPRRLRGAFAGRAGPLLLWVHRAGQG
jgi:hypothetical protein